MLIDDMKSEIEKDEVYISCPICGSLNLRTLFKKTRIRSLYNPPVLYSNFNTQICFFCGHIFRNPMPQSIVDGTYYKKDYETVWRKSISATLTTKEIQNSFSKHINRNTNFFKFLQENQFFKNTDNSNQNLLEIGSGGGFLAYLIAKNFKDINVHAVEPGRDPHKCIESLPNLTFYRMDIMEFFNETTWENKFDYIILNGVIEHIPFLKPLMSKINNFANSDGLVYLYTHNEFPHPFVSWKIRISFPHVQYFDKTTIERLLNTFGFRVLKRTIIGKTGMHVIAEKTDLSSESKAKRNNMSLIFKYVSFWILYHLDIVTKNFESYERKSRKVLSKLLPSKFKKSIKSVLKIT